MSDDQKKVLFENTGRAIDDVPHQVKLRHFENCTKADPAYGEGIAKALDLSMSEIPKGGYK